MKKAKKKSYTIKGSLAAAALIIFGLMFWTPGNQNFEPSTGLSAQFSNFEGNMYQGGPALSGSRALNQLAFLNFCLIFDCISNPDLAREAAEFSDGVIVGSAVVSLIEKNSDPIQRNKKLAEFVCSIKEAVSNSS